MARKDRLAESDHMAVLPPLTLMIWLAMKDAVGRLEKTVP
jgi:hypothetical protein